MPTDRASLRLAVTLRRGSRFNGSSSAPNSATISFNLSGLNTLAASENEPSDVRGQPSFFWTLANSLACCKPRSDVTTGLNR